MAENTSDQFLHPRTASENQNDGSAQQDHGISINLPPDHEGRPPPVKHM
jgi:hypothetical protein